jgi:hypothetical protein
VDNYYILYYDKGSMATEMYMKQIAGNNSFSSKSVHTHHHRNITAIDSLPSSLLSYRGYLENGGQKVK